MPSDMAQLAHLQQVEQQAAALQAQIAAYPEKVAARERAVAKTGQQLEENQKALAAEAAARRRMESDTDDLRRKKDRYQAQLDSVQSDSQASALEHQIAFCQQEISRIEDEEFASLLKTETLETTQRTLHETLVNLKQALAVEQEAALQGRTRDEAALAELNAERDAVRHTVEEKLLAEYDRLAKGKRGPVATVEQQRCSACQMVVRPQRWNEIREGAIHFCESCGRFLHYDPAVDLSAEIALPAAHKKPANSATVHPHADGPHAATGSGDVSRSTAKD